MDSILKLVYDNWTDYNFPLPNGRHPAINQLLKDDIKTNNREVWAHSQDVIQQQVSSNVFQFDHSNFWTYFKKYYPRESIVKVSEVTDPSCVYIWPIEIRSTNESIYSESSFTLNGETITYSLIDTINPELVKLMQLGRVKILINLAHDPLDDDLHLIRIEEYFERYNIDGSNIMFVPGNDLTIEKQKYFPNCKIKIIPSELMITQQFAANMLNYPFETSLGYVSDIVRSSDLNKDVYRDKKFLCFNRSMRPHRYMIAYYALKHNLFENGTFSFLNQTINEQSIIKTITKFNPDESIDLCEKYSHTIFNMIPYELDTKHLTESQRMSFNIANNLKELYTSSYVHLTTETRFEYGESPFITEKTWRPIINLQPFIMIGNAGTLKFLHNMGFKTFNGYIDESYDLEFDPVKRFSMIEKEIVKLNNMSLEELHNWYYSMTDILLYNQEHLKTFANINPFASVFDEIKKAYK
jgi:hypothetical protein